MTLSSHYIVFNSMTRDCTIIGSVLWLRDVVISVYWPDRAGWGLNLYAYAPNPLSYIDPLGLLN